MKESNCRKVNVDANQEFAAKYGVRNIPTVLVFKDGEVVGRQVGVPQNSLRSSIRYVISTIYRKRTAREKYFFYP